MNEATLVERYGGRRLDETELSSYEKWSLGFFHQEEFVREPCLQMTLQLDITRALETYESRARPIAGSSFTRYLMFHLARTTRHHPAFRYRRLEQGWYLFDDLPLLTPIAVGGDRRFGNLVVEGVMGQSLEEFFEAFRDRLEEVRGSAPGFVPLDPLQYAHSLFIGNLPGLQFTGFTLHTGTRKNGRPFFYFGRRYSDGQANRIPFLVTFDHANLDPLLLSAFMEEFEARLRGDHE